MPDETPSPPDVTPESEAHPSVLHGRLPLLLATLAATGAGAGAYRHLRRRRLSADPAMRALQEQAGGKFTRVLAGSGKERGRVGRFLDRLLEAGGGNVAYEKDLKALKDQLGHKPEISGALMHRKRTGSAYATGDVNLASNQAAKDIHEKLKNDKWREYKLIEKTTPGAMGRSANVKHILADMGYPEIPTDPAARAEMLDKLQTKLRTDYGKGFLLKDTRSAETGGAFPTEKHDFKDLLDRWTSSGYHADKARIMEESGFGRLGSANRKALKTKHFDTYSGRVIEKLLNKPGFVMVQEKLPLEQGSALGQLVGKLKGNPSTKEMRVHVINGAVVPHATVPRFDPAMLATGHRHMRGAEDAAREIVGNLPKKYQGATFAMDIAPVRNPATGKIEYKTIETNPSGVSGMLYAKNNPLAGVGLHRAFTGRHSRPVAAVGGGLAGALAGAGTYGAAHAAARPASPETPEQESV